MKIGLVIIRNFCNDFRLSMRSLMKKRLTSLGDQDYIFPQFMTNLNTIITPKTGPVTRCKPWTSVSEFLRRQGIVGYGAARQKPMSPWFLEFCWIRRHFWWWEWCIKSICLSLFKSNGEWHLHSCLLVYNLLPFTYHDLAEVLVCFSCNCCQFNASCSCRAQGV